MSVPEVVAFPTPTLPNRKLYFDNNTVEDLMLKYRFSGCTDVVLRDMIMENTEELIRQIIRAHNLHKIYPGQEESAFMDLFQTAWCVSPDTIVFTKNGMEQLGSIIGTDDVGDCGIIVDGRDGPDRATKYVRFKERHRAVITTKYGYNLKCSLDHPLYVWTSTGEERIRCQDLKMGDLLGIKFGQQMFGDDDKLDIRLHSKGGTTKIWNPPEKITTELAYIIGLAVSGGSIERGRVVIYNTSQEVRSAVVGNTLGLDFKYEQRGRMVVNSICFVEFLNALGVGSKCHNKTIPLRLLKCSKPIIRSFLRGMFDGDGHSNRRTGCVGYTSTSKMLIDQLRVVLLNFGIITKTSRSKRCFTRTPDKKGGYKQSQVATAYQLLLSTADSYKFYDQIGFNIASKQDKRRSLSVKPFVLIDDVSTEIVQNAIKDLPKRYFKMAGVSSRHLLLKKKRFSKDTLLKLLEAMPSRDDLLDRIYGIYNGNMLWLPIEDIAIGDVGEVVDIEVPKSGNFIANGIYSSNCQIERTLYKYKARIHCAMCYNPTRPTESCIFEPEFAEYEIITPEDVLRQRLRCPTCRKIPRKIIYRGTSKVFNLWCVRPETMLFTTNGIDSIGNVVNREGYDDRQEIWTLGVHGQPSKIIAGITKPVRSVLDIKTLLGYEIGCTPEHSLISLSGGACWKKAAELKLGDLLAIQFNHQFFIDDDDISDVRLTEYRAGCSGITQDQWDCPKTINRELAYIIGLYIAEGSYTRNKCSGQLVIYNTDKEIINKLTNNKLGLKFVYHPKAQAIICCNKRFIELLQALGLERTKAHTKEIPPRLLRVSKANMVAMISGMFDGDGHSSRHNGQVGYTSTSRKLIDQLRMLLLNLGIVTKLSIDKRKTSEFVRRGKSFISEKQPAYQLTCSTSQSLRFYTDIGFAISRKQANINRLPAERDYIYGINENFRSLYRKYGCGKLGYDKCVANGVPVFLDNWADHANDDDFKFIQNRLDEYHEDGVKTVWLPIIDIKQAESQVCEISVDSPDHSYVANGIISHNSQVARTVILAYIKKENRDHKNSSAYKKHLDDKKLPKTGEAFTRFLIEARQLCKYNKNYLDIVDALECICRTDDRPHEGIISKLTKLSGQSRAQIANFLRLVRLRCHEFTDSPRNDKQHRFGPVATEEDW